MTLLYTGVLEDQRAHGGNKKLVQKWDGINGQIVKLPVKSDRDVAVDLLVLYRPC